MSIKERRWLPPLVITLAVVLATTAAVAWIGGDPIHERRRAAGTAIEESERLPQAAWTIKTFAAGTAGPPKRAHKKAVQRERPRLLQVVTSVADAIVFTPTEIGNMAGKELSPVAAVALASSKLPLPGRISDVQLIRRKASIGLDANGAKRAAAKVTMLIEGTVDGAPVRLSGDSHMFLQKKKGRWQVVAFEGERAPKHTAAKKSRSEKPARERKARSARKKGKK